MSSKLNSDPALRLTLAVLEEGLPELASSMVDIEHNGRDLNCQYFACGSGNCTGSNICVVEHFASLRFCFSSTYFNGPAQQSALALITCPNASCKQVVSVDPLDRCFYNEVSLLCSKKVLETTTSFNGRGFAWNPEIKISFLCSI